MYTFKRASTKFFSLGMRAGRWLLALSQHCIFIYFFKPIFRRFNVGFVQQVAVELHAVVRPFVHRLR